MTVTVVNSYAIPLEHRNLTKNSREEIAFSTRKLCHSKIDVCILTLSIQEIQYKFLDWVKYSLKLTSVPVVMLLKKFFQNT